MPTCMGVNLPMSDPEKQSKLETSILVVVLGIIMLMTGIGIVASIGVATEDTSFLIFTVMYSLGYIACIGLSYYTLERYQ